MRTILMLIPVSICLFSLSASAESPALTDPPVPADPTRQMVTRLEMLAQQRQRDNDYDSRARLAYLLASQPGPTLNEQIIYWGQVSEETLNSGDTHRAAQAFREVQRFFLNDNRPVPHGLQVFEGLANLRTALRDNCASAQATRCAIPPAPGSQHPDPTFARLAISRFERVLANNPEPQLALLARWMLNLAYMTTGDYPHKVPTRWLIPAASFAPEHDIKTFRDRAPALGLNVSSRAGGSIMDDLDGDGDLDIMASSWGMRDPLSFFVNDGDGTFKDATEAAGLTGIVGGLNLVHADFDNDGALDVLVLRGGWLKFGYVNSLLRNKGNGTFEDVTEAAGLLAAVPGQTAAWGDFDNDGWLDLFVGAETQPGAKTPFVCQLFHNNGDGTFTDVAARMGVDVVGFVKAVSWGDYDNDGRLDLFVSRLREPNLLFHNNGPSPASQKRFTEVGSAAGVQEPLASFPAWFFDYNNDGWLDIFVSGTNATVDQVAAEYLGLDHGAEVPRLFRNLQNGKFADVTKAARVDRIMLTMGSNFGDLDNDGYLDFYVGTGAPSPRFMMPNRMFRNAGGEFFQEVTASGGFGTIMKGHGVSFGDIDHDGDQDLYVVLGGAYEVDLAQNQLFENPGHGNSWVTLLLQGVKSNRSAIGARIRVNVATPSGTRDIHVTVGSGGSFGASSLQQEIGLGDATAIGEVVITWPAGGAQTRYAGLKARRAWRITEGNAIAMDVTRPVVPLGAR